MGMFCYDAVENLKESRVLPEASRNRRDIRRFAQGKFGRRRLCGKEAEKMRARIPRALENINVWVGLELAQPSSLNGFVGASSQCCSSTSDTQHIGQGRNGQTRW